jgi:hypothetical protein
MKKFSLIYLFLAISFCINAQNDTESYNLPPNAKLYNKTNVNKDYSHKLYDNPNYDQVKKVESDFKFFLTDENYADMQANDQISFRYYKEAEAYFDGLSHKVKALYTAEEIWHIYYFDQKLKNHLTTIQ